MVRRLFAFTFLIFALPMLFGQGSLTPPGAPAPSMKTLGQIEPRTPIGSLPFRIEQEGSYYVTTNLTVPNGTNGISIYSSGVTIDLGGFVLKGGERSKEGIFVAPGEANIAVRNGIIVSTETGISAANSSKLTLDNLIISDTRASGISAGAETVIDRCHAIACEGTGIKVGSRSQVQNSRAVENFEAGFELGLASTLRDCAAAKNGASGVIAGSFCKLLSISAQENATTGIEAADNVIIADSSASQNHGSGIVTGTFALISRVTASFNMSSGITVAKGGSITDCNTSGNSTLGIAAGTSSQIVNAKAEGNNGGGISADEGSTVRDSNANRNGNDGIRVTSECNVSRNTCNNNINIRAAAGVHATGTDNVIQENTVVSNDRGLAVDTDGNLIIKNSATNNSLNYYVIGEQTMGPVVSRLDDLIDVISPVSNFAF